LSRLATRLLALLAALAAAAGASRAEGGGAPACAERCPPPVLAAPEPALRRAVHLAWSEPHGARARLWELERRETGPGGEWTPVARLPADRAPHHDDGGPPAAGLAPGEYAYRIRGSYAVRGAETWSEWSAPQAATVRAGCAEAGGELGGLPRVLASDRDGDGRHTGADLERALRACSALGGCVLELLPAVYDDVAIVLSNGDPNACARERTACLTDAFPRGLAIEGHGRASVLRSPLWKTPYVPQPVLEVWRRPELRIALRHLVLDGRKSEQRDPVPGRNNANEWRHVGFQVWNQWFDHDRPNRGGCVHGVVARELMSRGISLADVDHWNVEHGAVEGIGCQAELTPCARLAIPDHSGPGHASNGYGIFVDWHSTDVVVRANRIRRVTKYSIGLKHGQDGSEPSIVRPLVEDNDIDEAGWLGIFLGGVADGLFQGNRIAATHTLDARPETRGWNDTFGISCVGVAQRTGFRRNRIEDVAGMAISWKCVGPQNYFAQTAIARTCREKGPRSCAPGAPRSCYLQPDVWVAPGSAGGLAFVDGEVSESGCAAPLGVDLEQPELEVRIRGGRWAAGPAAVQPVRFTAVDVVLERGAAFTGTGLAFGRGTRAIVAPTVSVRGTTQPFHVDRSARVLLCSERPRDCQAFCAVEDPPSWCAEPGAR
jgi:hypothetical protein